MAPSFPLAEMHSYYSLLHWHQMIIVLVLQIFTLAGQLLFASGDALSSLLHSALLNSVSFLLGLASGDPSQDTGGQGK